MPPSDRQRLEAAGATDGLIDLLLVPRPSHPAQVSAFERWAWAFAAGETAEDAAEMVSEMERSEK